MRSPQNHNNTSRNRSRQLLAARSSASVSPARTESGVARRRARCTCRGLATYRSPEPSGRKSAGR